MLFIVCCLLSLVLSIELAFVDFVCPLLTIAVVCGLCLLYSVCMLFSGVAMDCCCLLAWLTFVAGRFMLLLIACLVVYCLML